MEMRKMNLGDYQRKQNTLKSLKRKALDKNPDEFYFNMVKTQKVDGIHQERESSEPVHTEAEVKLMLSQDLHSKKEAKEFDAAKHFNTHPSLVHRTFNRPRLETLKSGGLMGLQAVDDDLEDKKAKKKKVEDETKISAAQYRWRYQRKR
ncbi:hypothetical protein KUTeg_008009 [Tegillarca granosa]|uniref:Probable U3 small nucleolar RNA-associated protein 11 n=1 Tax=Tegillarca granosa TaxID=220873 RepID=A0ABQ9FEY6_TEGGR|nr:hypothetical protein KUTeg_008009 [Tegillarca granosa]